MGNIKGVSKSYPNGSKWLQKCGDYLEIISFLGGGNFKVKFEDTEVFKAQAKEIKNGVVVNRNKLTILDAGFIGYGKYKTKVGNCRTKSYQVWTDMLRRCYDKNRDRYVIYGGRGVTVCKEWHNFQVFAEWCESNYIEGYCLDKDLVNYKNKVYSPETCSFLPTQINSLFTGGFKSIVYLRRGKWVAQIQKGEKCSNGNKRQSYLGEYECKEEALNIYFEEKIKHIEQVVKKFKDTIDERVVENLLDSDWVKDYIKYLSGETY